MSVFAGFAKTLTGDLSGSSPRNATGKPKSLHEIFVAQQILPLTVKLQKEMRGRRNAVSYVYRHICTCTYTLHYLLLIAVPPW